MKLGVRDGSGRKEFFYRGTEHLLDRRVRRMALHHLDEVRVGWGLQLVLRDFLDAVDEASARDTVEQGLGVGRTELEIGDDVGPTDPDREALKACRGADGLAMTGDERNHRQTSNAKN